MTSLQAGQRLFLLVVSFCFLTLVVDARESAQDAAKLARNLVDSSHDSIGNLATVYPSDHETLAHQPFSLQEYYASCHKNGSLTFLFLPISRHSQNILHSPNGSVSLSITTRHPAASKARVSLLGRVTLFEDIENTPDRESIATCYLLRHPDAIRWLPGNKNQAHIAYWARFDPHTVYYVGGFGDEHYIGYILMALYRDAYLDDQLDSDSRGVAGRLLVEQS